MTTSAYMPDVKVEIAFNAGYSTPTGSRTWTDVSSYVELKHGISITHGRGDEFATAEPNRCTLTLDNTDGRFTAGRAAAVARTNLARNPGGETANGWGSNNGALYVRAADAVVKRSGTQSIRFTRTATTPNTVLASVHSVGSDTSFTTAGEPVAAPGETHTASVYALPGQVGFSATISLTFKDAGHATVGSTTTSAVTPLSSLVDWTRIQVSALAPAGAVSYNIGFGATANVGNAATGDFVNIDDAMANVGSTAFDYFDGSTGATYDAELFPLSHAWTGTANSSPSTESLGHSVKIGRPIKVTSTPVGGAASIRFLGYIEEWPVAWDGAASYAKAQITATSRLARLGFNAELRSSVTEEFLGGAPAIYYPLGEAAGASRATDLMGGTSLALAGAGAAPTFGAGNDLINAGTGVTFSATGGHLATTLSTPITTGVGVVVRLEAFINDYETAGGPVIVKLFNPGDPLGTPFFTMERTGSSLYASTYDGSNQATVSHPDVFTGTAPLHVAATMTISGIDEAVLTLYVDGAQVATVTDTGWFTGASTLTKMSVGDRLGGVDTLSHVAVNADLSKIAARAAAGLTGFANEAASDRIKRYARYAGIATAEVSAATGTNPLAPVDTTGSDVLDAMRKVEETEGGILFDGADNTLTFHGRAARYHTVSAFTLSAASQQIEADIAPKLDRSTLVNDITATSADGTSSRAINQTSIDEYGYARTSIDIAGTPDDAYQAAAWRVALYSQPAPRIPALGVDLLAISLSLQASLLTAGIGTRFTVSGLPTQAAAASLDFFIEGYNESIGPESYEFSLNVSPVQDAFLKVWILEDATYGAYDSNPLSY